MSFPYYKAPVMGEALYSMAEVGAQERIISFYDRIPGPWRTAGEITFRRFATSRVIPSTFCVYKVFHRVNGVEILLAQSDHFPDPRDAIQNLSEKVFYDNGSLLFPSPLNNDN